jgi:hypothetical protein
VNEFCVRASNCSKERTACFLKSQVLGRGCFAVLLLSNAPGAATRGSVMNVDETIGELLRSDRISFLVGAGISIPSPSRMLPGRSFINAIVSRISPTKQIADELILLSDPERYERHNKGDFLRFEGVMQCIRADLDAGLEVLQFLADVFPQMRTTSCLHIYSVMDTRLSPRTSIR